jgi:DNA-binding GntR family transcriptional regulator
VQPHTDVLCLVTDAQDDRAATALGLLDEHSSGGHGPHPLRRRHPLAVLRNWLPAQYADITQEQLSSNGLNALLRARGVRPKVSRQTIGARNAGREDRRLLH